MGLVGDDGRISAKRHIRPRGAITRSEWKVVFQGAAGHGIGFKLSRPWSDSYCTHGQFWYWPQPPGRREPFFAFPMPRVGFCYNFVLHFFVCTIVLHFVLHLDCCGYPK